jgi:hypothetical protein
MAVAIALLKKDAGEMAKTVAFAASGSANVTNATPLGSGDASFYAPFSSPALPAAKMVFQRVKRRKQDGHQSKQDEAFVSTHLNPPASAQ